MVLQHTNNAMNGYVMGHDTPSHLILYFDTGFEEEFYPEFYRRCQYRPDPGEYNVYRSLLIDPFTASSSYLNRYSKDGNYALDDCIKEFSKCCNMYWDKIYFPIYIIKDGWWHIIKDDNFLMIRDREILPL